jgi:ATP-binding cassette subfamily B protein/ATP-binding cassette subfamily C protein
VTIPLREYWQLLAKYLRPQRASVALLAVLLFSVIGLRVLNPQIIRAFLDAAESGAALQPLLIAGGLFLTFALVVQVMSVAATYVGEKVGWTATNNLRADLALHCMRLDMSFHNDKTPGEMIERIDGDVMDLAIFFSQLIIQVLGNLLLLIGVLFAVALEDWRVGLALAVFSAIGLFSLNKFRDVAVPHWKTAREAHADLYGFIEEQLAGTEDIRSSGATDYVMRGLYRHGRKVLHAESKAGLMGIRIWLVWNFWHVMGRILAFVAGYALFSQGLITLGTVYVLVYYTEMIFGPLRHLTMEMENFQKAAGSIARLRELLSLQSTVRDEGQAKLNAGPLGVSFHNVSFSYRQDVQAAKTDPAGSEASADHLSSNKDHLPELLPYADELADAAYSIDDSTIHDDTSIDEANTLVLKNVSFAVPAGKVLGVLGHTGSGKTTIARLLFRLYDATSGQICLSEVLPAANGHHNGAQPNEVEHSIKDIPLRDLPKHIGIVTQDVQIFRATVRQNLTLFDKTISDERVIEVIRDLELSDWFDALPKGLDTELEGGGKGLSAGEAQLLAFARVFLRNPGLVILDEASSRLDPATERRIEHAIDELLYGTDPAAPRRTAIIIAHRLATVQRADDILILEGGRVVEYGPRLKLMRDPDSRFSQLLRIASTASTDSQRINEWELQSSAYPLQIR